MTTKELKQIDDSVIKHGDDFWNDNNDNNDNNDADGGPPNPNRGWIVVELLELLAEDNLDLKLIPKQ